MTSRMRFLAISVFFLSAIPLLAQTTFTKITAGDIVNDGGDSFGGSWGDFDNDGDLDLVVTNSLTAVNFLYRNNGNGSFTRIRSGPVANDDGNSYASSWCDYDNDGDLDLLVANTDSERNFLFQNNGSGSFTRITTGDIVNEFAVSLGVTWGDYDNDSRLDLFVANGGLNFLYRNDGDPDGSGQVTFTRIIDGSFLRDFASSYGPSWVDYDNDGDLDLFVANTEENYLYQNNGNGSFTRITSGAIATDTEDSRGASWGDYDNDGDLDLFVANRMGTNSLYQNEGNGNFTKITNGAIVNAVGNSRGSSWGDYDNDGDLDLFVANVDENNSLYQNDGDGTFTPITAGDIVNDGEYSYGCSWADYDNDGDLDLFVVNGRHDVGTSEERANFLYQNNGNSNNWINIKCVGTFSNISAIGAKVKVKATIDGKPVWQLREISAQTGFAAQNSLNAHFGLGDATGIDSVEISWPSGRNQVVTDHALNRFLTVIEPVPLVVQQSFLVDAGDEIAVVATDTSGEISEVMLDYRRGGESGFTTVSMSAQGNGSFQGTIPGSEVTSRGVDYRLEATDQDGRSARLPTRFSYSARVRVPDGLSTDEARPHGSAQTAYRIFSVPLDLDNANPAALLEDDLGEYDRTRWRFSEYSRGALLEFPEISFIEAGKGYWFLVSEPARVIDTGPGTTITTAGEYGTALASGWNLIGNPFNFSIPVENLRLASGGTVVLRSFTGAWNNPVGSPVSQIVPFEGYAIFNDQTGSDVLFVNPDLSSAGLAKTSKPKNDLSFLRMQESPSHEQPRRETPAFAGVRSNDDVIWSILIRAQCQDARDVDNVLGVSPLAADAWDELDFPEPPPVGEYVSVYFPRPEWRRLNKRFCTDFRPLESATHLGGASHLGNAWEFEVKSNIRDRIKLTFAGLESVPSEFEVWLVDESLKLSQNLRDNYVFVLAGEEQPKRLKLLVGKSEFVQQDLANLQGIPNDFELSQNFPNPFNPVTTIRFGLPKVESVTLKVYNILGELVATLLDDEKKSAGHHVAIWDGRDRRDRQVASGLYVYQLVAGDARLTRKMALVR